MPVQPTYPGFIPAPQFQSPIQLQQNATATPQPPTATPQLSNQLIGTSQATATQVGWTTVLAWRGLDSNKPGDVRRGIRIDDPSQNEPLGGMSVYEASNPQSLNSRFKSGLPFYISYKGEKTQGTLGTVYGILPGGTNYAIAGGAAMYTPGAGGPGHWTITVKGLTNDEVKRAVLDYAEQYFNIKIPFPIVP